ncbi:uncharacterized protein DS421_3g94870 [Arachis hypogaea]|nr:uncharacterized protein DS421_3g94870 [Arachis hypogaea]
MNGGDTLHGWVDRKLGLPFSAMHSMAATMQVSDGGGGYGSGLLLSTGAPSLFLRSSLSLLVFNGEEPKGGGDGKKRRWSPAVKVMASPPLSFAFPSPTPPHPPPPPNKNAFPSLFLLPKCVLLW